MTLTQSPLAALFRNSIGYDHPSFSRLTEISTTFPPHNIERVNDDSYRLTLAIAGYDKSEISLNVQNDLLTVTGQKTNSEETRSYLHKGIALRDFTRQFKLGEYIEVTNATLSNGLLTIELERRIPEAAKPKIIVINEPQEKVLEAPSE